MNVPESQHPLDDIRALVGRMPQADAAAAAAVRMRDAVLTKPAGALGRLEEIAEWLAAWQGRAPPAVNRPLVAVFAGNHGVVGHGVSAYPAAVTAQLCRYPSPTCRNAVPAAISTGARTVELLPSPVWPLSL